MKHDADSQAARALLAALRVPIDVPAPDDSERERLRPELERWISALPNARAQRSRWQRFLDARRGTVADGSQRFVPRAEHTDADGHEPSWATRWTPGPRFAGWALAACCAAVGVGYLFQRVNAPMATQVPPHGVAEQEIPEQARAGVDTARGTAAEPSDESSSSASLIAGTLFTADGHELAVGSRFGVAKRGSVGAGASAPSDNQVVHTRDSQSALLLIASGVQTTFSPNTVARLPARVEQPELGLLQGQVSLDVPPMPTGTSFVVQTPDTRVTVHGTRFTVSYPNAQGGSCVRVMEGRVGVKGPSTDVLLGPGEAVGCDDVPNPAPERHRQSKTDSEEQSTLAVQNQLLQQTLVKERQGDAPGARRALRSLLAKYPESPFAPEARRALSRLNTVAP